MTERDLHWLAGLLEGEGCFSGGAIQLGMVDRDIVERAAALLDADMRGPIPPSGRARQPSFRVRCSVATSRLLLPRLAPLFGARRRAQVSTTLGSVEPVEPRAFMAWLAGLCEGEGHFGTAKRPNGTVTAIVCINMTDRDVLQRVAAWDDTCRVLGPYQGPSNVLPYWRWRKRGRPAAALMRALGPSLGVRRRQRIAEVLAASGD